MGMRSTVTSEEGNFGSFFGFLFFHLHAIARADVIIAQHIECNHSVSRELGASDTC